MIGKKMKRILLIWGMMCVCFTLYAQSTSLQDAYLKVSTTFKNYQILSYNIYYYGQQNSVKMKNKIIEYKPPYLIISWEEAMATTASPSWPAKPGKYSLKIPLSTTTFSINQQYHMADGSYPYVDINCPEGIEYYQRGETTIENSYRFDCISEASARKFMKEIIDLQQRIKQEGYSGILKPQQKQQPKTQQKTQNQQQGQPQQQSQPSLPVKVTPKKPDRSM